MRFLQYQESASVALSRLYLHKTERAVYARMVENLTLMVSVKAVTKLVRPEMITWTCGRTWKESNLATIFTWVVPVSRLMKASKERSFLSIGTTQLWIRIKKLTHQRSKLVLISNAHPLLQLKPLLMRGACN